MESARWVGLSTDATRFALRKLLAFIPTVGRKSLSGDEQR